MASASANAQPRVPNGQNRQQSNSHPTQVPQSRTSLKTTGNSSELLHPLRPLQFPLPGYDFRLVCSQCFKDNSAPLQMMHTCREELLIVNNRVTPRWRLIREPMNWDNVHSYTICRSVCAGVECFRGQKCWFAHSQDECNLWNMQKSNAFRLEDFITSNQSPGLLSRYTVEAVYEKFKGHMGFLCRLCIRQNLWTGFQDPSQEYCSTEQHLLKSTRVLAHYDNKTRKFTAIGQRPFTKKTSYYNMCYWERLCRKPECFFAHSIIEYDLWYVQKDSNLNEEQIIEKWQATSAPSSDQSIAGQTFNRFTGDQSSYEGASPASSTLQPPSYNSRRASSAAAGDGAAPSITSRCPLTIAKVCSVCYHSGRKLSKKRVTGNHCANGHDWDINKVVYVVVSSKKVVRRLPQGQKGRRASRKFRMCARAKKDCRYSSKCRFAHNDEEMALWAWMEKSEVNSLDAIIEMQEERISSQSVQTTKTWSTSQTTPVSSAWPTPYQSVQYFCEYCSRYFDSQAHLEGHCVTFEHQGNVSSDKDHQWNHRQPPWNVRNGQYRLCPAHLESKCRFTDVDEKFNYCTFAHSQEQLDEWKERYKWRQMKIKAAQQDNLYSYISRLKEEYNVGGCTVLSETVDEVIVDCSGPLSIVDERKDKVKEWTFTLLSATMALQRVVLLHEEGALHFILVGASLEKDCQIADGDEFFIDEDNSKHYKVTVRFTGGLFGSFRQWIVFDFGQNPKLVQKLTVDLGRLEVCDRLLTLRKQLNFDRWTTQNRKIVRMPRTDRSVDEFTGLLLAKYNEPNIDEITIHQIDQSKLNRHNYTQRMHRLIGLEEMAQAKTIATESQYDVVTKMYLSDRLDFEMSGIQCSRPGELFAKVTLENRIIEGSLISSSSVSSVLLSRPGTARGDFVYEANVTYMADHPLKGSHDIFLTLSQQCCRELNLRVGQRYDVEVQFQLDRMPFCRMRYAIDQLNNTNIIFPAEAPGGRPSAGTMPSHLQTRSSALNEDQNTILNFVLGRSLSSWPLVVYGPFGTGKTRTLAEAAMILTARTRDAYILICTLTNHAADEYILRYFHPLAEERQLSFLRVYDKFRLVNRVDPKVLEYSLRSGHSKFCEPTTEDIKGKRIVVTTLETSLVIARLEEDLKGHFTHIFIDEAAQANECRAVMPLCLANESTRVVLAGDHIQMTEPVRSEDARRQNFHVSLVERLMSSYINNWPTTQNKPMVLLRANYRNHPEIVRFVGRVFYGGDDILKSAKGQATDVRAFPALIFHAANGREMQSEHSTSIYNEAEVIEVVEQVNRIMNEWPFEWGEPNPEEILITTPYADQVSMIRNKLRCPGNHRLGKVVVLKVQNVPGKEFRAVIISTVRTRHLLEESSANQELSLGFLSDDKMLNSALTRAKSSVTVVGDPVALCCIGKCSKIWRQYLKHCQQLKSIRPAIVTVESIRLQVNAVMANLSNARAEDSSDDAQNDAEHQHQQQTVGGVSENENWNNYQPDRDKTLSQLMNFIVSK